MKLSVPVYRLKRQATLLSRREGMPHHAALDRVAAEQGFRSWSLLAAQLASASPGQVLLGRLAPGDLLLIAARPGHGKTLLSLQLAAEAVKAGGRCVFFTLEYTQADLADRFARLGVAPAALGDSFVFDGSDAISAGHVVEALATAPTGTMAIVDYLQLLDQRRENPDLLSQVRTLKSFAGARGLILVFISQVDRSYDPATTPCPTIADVRLPNPVDLSLFNKRCFLNAGELRFETLN